MPDYGHREAFKDLATVKSYSLAIDMVDCGDEGVHLSHAKRLAAYVDLLEAAAGGSSSDLDSLTESPYGHDEAIADLSAMKSISLVMDMANDSEDESRLLPVNRLAEYIQLLETEVGVGSALLG